jgi:hypothetical protein
MHGPTCIVWANLTPFSLQENDAFDQCDGCAGHPGVEGHRGIYEAAWPIIAEVMHRTVTSF